MSTVTKAINVYYDTGFMIFYSYSDGTYKFLFEIDTKKNTLIIYNGVDAWNKDILKCTEHWVIFDKKSKVIDWWGYIFDKVNFPDPFPSEFKRYAQKILNLQIFS